MSGQFQSQHEGEEFLTASRVALAIRFGIPGIKLNMKTNKKFLCGTGGVVVLGFLLGGWEAAASGGRVMEAINSVRTDARPAIDRETPLKTERAVFALG